MVIMPADQDHFVRIGRIAARYHAQYIARLAAIYWAGIFPVGFKRQVSVRFQGHWRQGFQKVFQFVARARQYFINDTGEYAQSWLKLKD